MDISIIISGTMQSENSEELVKTSDSDRDDKKSNDEGEELTVALFDWDDTLFCTQYFEMLQVECKAIFSEEKSLENFGAYLLSELQLLEEKVLNLFSELLEKEIKVFIVTNADEKWVKNCLSHFLPDLREFLTENEVKIYSAKKLFANNTPVEKWKTKCFKKLILDNFPRKNSSLKVLAIGDSSDEKLAALALKGLDYHREINVKFLELRKFPDITTLITQFQFIEESFLKIVESNTFFHKIR